MYIVRNCTVCRLSVYSTYIYIYIYMLVNNISLYNILIKGIKVNYRRNEKNETVDNQSLKFHEIL